MVQDEIKEEFVANTIQVEMQCHHFYTTCHVTKAISAAAAY
jgi:hypothetical protein